ncbi:MAG: sterol desaturase family protein [Leptospira sp.]|nr:sterol desaturase family protein [Leptospira sp.]
MKIIESLIPLFLTAIAIEAYFSHRKKRGFYNLADSMSDMSLGMISRLTDLFVLVGMFQLYQYIEARFSWDLWAWTINPIWMGVSWVALFLSLDFLFYWNHRFSHEINLLWASHVTHHSSEEYNLTVALRQSFLRNFIALIFYSLFAIIGVPWITLLIVDAMNRLYQFWVHTRFEWKFPRWFEFIFVTPSHHRVHHARNPEYIDKNYAGMFIIWDRIYGTYQEENAAPIYGIVSPLRSFNPLKANLHLFFEIGSVLASKLPFREKLKFIISPPGYRPKEEIILSLPAGSKLRVKWKENMTPEKSILLPEFRKTFTKPQTYYFLGSFLLLMICSLALIKSNLSLDIAIGIYILILAGFTVWGRFLDRYVRISNA